MSYRPSRLRHAVRRPGGLLAALVMVLGLALTACGSDDSDASGSSGSGTDEPVTVDVTFADGTVTPSGDRVEVGVGQTVELVVTADEPGEIHVHSDPEQELEYAGDGETTTLELAIDRPGIVEVESHDLDQLIVSLQVQ